MIWFGLMLIIGVLSLLFLALAHQKILPLERAQIRPEWKQHQDEVPEGPDRVEVTGDHIIVERRDGSTFHFTAPGMRLALGALTFVTVKGRRLLVVLDRGRLHRTYLIDIRRAAEKENIFEGVVGWWRHGTGYLVAADAENLLEVHRCFGRDRIYVLDPSRALEGKAFGLGIERTLIAPARRLGRADLHGRHIYISAGKRKWRTELFKSEK